MAMWLRYLFVWGKTRYHWVVGLQNFKEIYCLYVQLFCKSKNISRPLKMQALRSFKTSGTSYPVTWSLISERWGP
jgi:hypothetical protein